MLDNNSLKIKMPFSDLCWIAGSQRRRQDEYMTTPMT